MRTLKQHTLQNQLFFYALFGFISLMVLWLIQSYLGIVAFGLVMVIILKPVYDWFHRWFPRWPGLATILTIITFIVVTIIPVWIMVQISLSQITAIAEDIPTGEPIEDIDELFDRVDAALAQYPQTENIRISGEQREALRTQINNVVTSVAGQVVNVGLSVPDMIANAFVFFGIIGVLLPNYHQFVRRLIRLSPLDDEVDRLFLSKLKMTIWSMFIGIFVIAIAQGLITGLFFWLGDVPYSALWTLIAVLTSVLPLGAALIAVPVGLVQLVTGNYISGIVILAGYLLIVTNIDNLIRPRLVSKEAYLNFALLMLSALGGYQVMGFFGVIYGPALMILFLTTVDVYEKYYLSQGAPNDEAVQMTKGGTNSDRDAPLQDETTVSAQSDEVGGSPATAKTL